MHICTVYWKTDERLLFRVTVRPEEGLVLSLHVVRSSPCSATGCSPSIATAASCRAARRQPQFRARRRVRSRRDHEFPAQGSAAHPHGAGRLQRPQPVQGGSGDRPRRADGAAQRDRGRLVARCRWQPGGSHHWLRAAPSACSARTTEGKWRRFYSMRITRDERAAGVRSVGPSDQPGKYYVLARPPGQGSRRPLSIRHRERAVRRPGDRKPDLRPGLGAASRAMANTSSAIATSRTCASAASPIRRSKRT